MDGKRAALAALIRGGAPNRKMYVDEARYVVQRCEAYMQIYGCVPFPLFERYEAALAQMREGEK